MQLVRRIRIKGFRSFHDQVLDRIDHLHVFVGKNSSGKSNVLRALNLFFNGEPQPGMPLSFARDLHERPTRRQKKEISISVDFELPSNFKIRKELGALGDVGRNLTVTRRWELDRQRNPVSRFEVVSPEKTVTAPDEVARQLLSLVSYRYVPNRTIPAEILRGESQAIADAIFMRMKGDTHASAVLKGLNAAASRMLTGAAEALERSGSPLTAPSLATAGSLGEMLRMTGFQAMGPHGREVQDEDWGAGHQAFFLYQILYILDTEYSRFFGWRQATIWGLEEPESGLHQDLATRLAESLRSWATAEHLRLQVFMTTHSPTFSMAAGSGAWVEVSGTESQLSQQTISGLTKTAEVAGVSPWTHPILSFPWNPVVLVEGSLDEAVLNHVASLAGYPALRFLCLPSIDASEPSGGRDSVIAYLRRNGTLIANRVSEAPFLVLLDWETTNQDMAKARVAYGQGSVDKVLRMDPGHADPLIGPDVRGIERFYSMHHFRDAQAAGEIAFAQDRDGIISVSSAQLNSAKGALSKRVLADVDPGRLRGLASLVVDVQQAIDSLNDRQRRLFSPSDPIKG